jgi:hypothetical protein
VKFKTGFLLGAAAGAWAASKASELQKGRRPGSGAGPVTEDAAERLRALTGLARERLAEVMEGPVGNAARERLADLIGSSISGAVRGSRSGSGAKTAGNRDSVNGSATIDTNARWPR